MASKQQWGYITWTFLHTLAEKIKEESFSTHAGRLVSILHELCQVLPCPDCSIHCSSYIKGFSAHHVKTKSDFICFLHRFHNAVNVRLRKPIMTLEACREHYSRANTWRVINTFLRVFSVRDAAPRLMLNNMYKGQFLQRLKGNISFLAGDLAPWFYSCFMSSPFL